MKFVAKPISIYDEAGSLQPIQKRAEILATYYETVQWAPEQLPPLPDRPPLFPVATELPTGVFTPAELREARPYMKSNKVTGTDEVPNEII